ncbi:thiol:disulfide interchange protein TlpA [Methylocella sp.]|uniref:thiol:disulfide interchange protein TlpA n=1 Tax=Methylocella sp. TaxID=1978226 RepID=UPI0037834374
MSRLSPEGDPEPSTEKAPGPVRASAWRRLAVFAGLIAAATLGLVYAIGSRSGNSEAAACPGARARALALAPLAKGEMAALVVAPWPRPAPEISFKGADGAPLTLASFKGRTALVNFWATWCVPCRREMPALDRLQGEKGSDAFEVVAINLDTARLERPKAFLSEIGATRLAFYADHSADALQTLKAAGFGLGLPTTLLIDRNGCGLASLPGAAEWDSVDAKAVVAAAQR